MDEEVREVEDSGREPKCHDKEKKHNCVINIFCDDMKDDKWDDHKDEDGNCIINIFCNDKKKHDDKCDGDDHDGNCIINIFCNKKHDKKHDDKCDDDKPHVKW